MVLCAAGIAAASAPPAALAAVEAYDATAEAGFVDARGEGGRNYAKSHTWSANVADFDGDTFEDVLVSTHYQGESWLMHNEPASGGGRHFQEVFAGTFADVDRHDCAWADVNQDDRLDAYCTLGAERGIGVGPNELWIQQDDGSFRDQARAFGVTDRYGRGRHATFMDLNGDPYPDLYVGNTYPRNDGRPSHNKLFVSKSGESFRRVDHTEPDRALGGESVQAVDYDRDGREDLLVCGNNGLRLFRNLGGNDFRDVSSETGARGTCQSALLVGLDGDQRPDLVRVADGGMVVKLQSGGEFRDPVFARSLQFGREVAAGDVDDDGDPDLYILRGGPSHSDAPDQPDLMLETRKEGREYRRIDIPQTTEGRGDSVSTIDYDANGLSDFLVLNGHSDTRGPLRLVAFRCTTVPDPCI